MNVSDYIVSFISEHGVNDVFGFQGTMIAYFVDAIGRKESMHNHSCYNEQGASFAACGYAQSSGKCAVAYSTSGPGAVNLLSGVANAYFDSLPVLFITGQLNTYEYLNVEGLRQQGFQEIDIVSMAKPVTKYAVKISDAKMIRYELEKAWYLANEGRAGSVLLDIPMNIQRTEIEPNELEGFVEPEKTVGSDDLLNHSLKELEELLKKSSRPVLLIGNGVKIDDSDKLIEFARKYRIPIVTSLLKKGFLSDDDELNFGYIGAAYGMRIANLLTCAKSDLLICIGISLCTRQIGTKIDMFAPDAKLFRIDADSSALSRKIKKDEFSFLLNSSDFIDGLSEISVNDYSDWLSVADKCRTYLNTFDDEMEEREPNRLVNKFGKLTKPGCVAVSDVGQHMMWMAQSFETKKGQKVLFSGGHGAMGYALPAAIGAYYATGKTVYCVAGDGAFQMNIQELEWVVRDNLPIKMLVLNNHSLGMIRFLQKDYFENRYEGTSEGYNYKSCPFAEVAKAYGIRAVSFMGEPPFDEIKEMTDDNEPLLIEITLTQDTFAYPKTYLGQEIYNQRPYVPEEKLKELLSL